MFIPMTQHIYRPARFTGADVNFNRKVFPDIKIKRIDT